MDQNPTVDVTINQQLTESASHALVPLVTGSLFDLVGLTAQIVQIVMDADGALTPELESWLSDVDVATREKIDAYYYVMERLSHESDWWEARARYFKDVSKSLSNAVERLKGNLKAAAINLNKTDLEGNDFRFKLSRVQPRLILDEAAIPGQYLKEVVSFVPDKEAIKADLEAGKDVPWARLEQGYAIRSYHNAETKNRSTMIKDKPKKQLQTKE